MRTGQRAPAAASRSAAEGPAGARPGGAQALPDPTDLIARLKFSTRDGVITMDGRRMLLLHAQAFGMLRREMIETLGLESTRGLLTRMGYQAGVLDARMALSVRSTTSLEAMFSVGPQMHSLEGGGLSRPVKVEFDRARGTHYGEFVWTHQLEDEEHLRHFPIGSEPSCWMQIGYASGYSTEFMGRPVLYREVECQSTGQSHCRIVGKPVEEWGEEALVDLAYVVPPGPAGAGRLAAGAVPPPRAALPEGVEGGPGRPVGASAGFKAVMHKVQVVAPTNATVLFLGESGVGKEVFARTLHEFSDRATKPFVAVNCAAIPEALIESELFGAERGAYTGAVQSRRGRFERADGGTLFLDEIGTLSLGAQGILLRALQEGEIERLGDSQTRRVDVRIVAATNVDLREEVRAGRFREDLYFRLNVFPVRIPSLRDRREDLPPLIAHFLQKYNRVHRRQLDGFTQRAIDAMLSYDWPGNIRELENIVERGVILTPGPMIDSCHLFTSGEDLGAPRFALDREGRLVPSDGTPADAEAQQPSLPHDQRIDSLVKGVELGEGISLDDVEVVLLRKALDRAQGNISAAARLLGITRPQMAYRLKSRGLLQSPE
jgi:DNA-binding NtrC family response regulator